MTIEIKCNYINACICLLYLGSTVTKSFLVSQRLKGTFCDIWRRICDFFVICSAGVYVSTVPMSSRALRDLDNHLGYDFEVRYTTDRGTPFKISKHEHKLRALCRRQSGCRTTNLDWRRGNWTRSTGNCGGSRQYEIHLH